MENDDEQKCSNCGHPRGQVVTEYRQGGLVFSHPYASRRLLVTDKAGFKVADLAVGNPFDSRPASLEEVQDAIDDYCSRPGASGHEGLDTV